MQQLYDLFCTIAVFSFLKIGKMAHNFKKMSDTNSRKSPLNLNTVFRDHERTTNLENGDKNHV